MLCERPCGGPVRPDSHPWDRPVGTPSVSAASGDLHGPFVLGGPECPERKKERVFFSNCHSSTSLWIPSYWATAPDHPDRVPDCWPLGHQDLVGLDPLWGGGSHTHTRTHTSCGWQELALGHGKCDTGHCHGAWMPTARRGPAWRLPSL